METKQSKLIRGVEFFYEIVKASVYFWFLLLKNGLVYGILPAVTYTMMYSTTNEKKEEKFFSVLKKRRAVIPYGKLISMAWFLTGSLLAVAYFLMSHKITPSFGLFQVASLVFFFLFTIYLCWVAWFHVKGAIKINRYALSLDQLVRHPVKSLYIGSLIVTASLIAWVNLFVFCCIVPGLFCWLVEKGLCKNQSATPTVTEVR